MCYVVVLVHFAIEPQSENFLNIQALMWTTSDLETSGCTLVSASLGPFLARTNPILAKINFILI